ncbi:unnamed protein product [Ostreobium quekettii]|uniref:Major facilitator superfamily (MFS) profile domain-containing protein n=1 Tax=Ostreobium quekettii TaxID=121088 RepID=A0A8S1IMQ4_9CHLO|nr:unnamed protein product [Ostreobium quekettii]
MSAGNPETLPQERVPLLGGSNDGHSESHTHDGQPRSVHVGEVPESGRVPERDGGCRTLTVSEAVDDIGMGRFQTSLLWAMGLSYAAEGAKMGAAALVAPLVTCEWGLSTGRESLLTLLYFLGALLGSYAFGVISDSIGRRNTYWYVALVAVVGSLGAAAAPSVEWLSPCFFLMGLVSTGATVGFVYVLEYLPSARRGRWGVMLTLPWALGTLAGAVVAWAAIPWLSWRGHLALLNAPYVGVFALLPLFPESAHYLAMKGGPEKAMEALRRVGKMNGVHLGAGVRLESLDDKVTNDKSLLDMVRESLRDLGSLVSRPLRGTTAVMLALCVSAVFAYNCVLILTAQVYTEEVGSCVGASFALSEKAYRKMLIVSAADAIGSISVIAMIDWAGRRRSLVAEFCAAVVALAPLLIDPAIDTTISLVVFRAVAYAAYCVLMVYIPELYPTDVRSLALGVGILVGSLGSLFAPFAAQELFVSRGLRPPLAIMCALSVMGAVAACSSSRETAGEGLQDALEAQPKGNRHPQGP